MPSTPSVPRLPVVLGGAALGLGAAALTSTSAHATGASSATEQFSVTAWYLNVRAEPTTASSTIGSLERGDVVSGTPLGNGWVSLASGGYVHGSWLKSAPPAAAETTYRVNTYLNVRQAPTAASDVVGLYVPGQSVTGTPVGNGWVKTPQGYAHGAYMTAVDKTAPEPDPTPAPAPSPDTKTYHVDRSVNVRAGAGMRHEITGMLQAGTLVEGTPEGGWVKTEKGWFWHSFATEVQPGDERVTPEPELLPPPAPAPTPEPAPTPTPEPEPEPVEPPTPGAELVKYVELPGNDQFGDVYAGPSYSSGRTGYVAEGGVVRGRYTADGLWFQAGPRSFIPASQLGDDHQVWTGGNGRLDPNTLCDNPIPGQEHQLLQCAAADGLSRLNAAYKNRFGHDMGLGECYRTYETQVLYKQRRGFRAAVPGTSQHGWAAACDLNEGEAQVGFRSAKYSWLRLNAPKYGWDNPTWAREGAYKPEYWHWEYSALTKYNALAAQRANGATVMR